MPTSFVVRSKENRAYNGVPISQGLIFVAENIEDLHNTKQFSKMSDKELNHWFNERYSGQLKNIPAMPNEPIAYFNLDDKVELQIDVTSFVSRPVRYVKFIPTAFRKKPINFNIKSFNSN